VIFAFGLAWLSLQVGATQAWSVGAAPFMAGTLVKTVLAAALVRPAGSSPAARAQAARARDPASASKE
jgi:biotin transporter BioY